MNNIAPSKGLLTKLGMKIARIYLHESTKLQYRAEYNKNLHQFMEDATSLSLNLTIKSILVVRSSNPFADGNIQPEPGS